MKESSLEHPSKINNDPILTPELIEEIGENDIIEVKDDNIDLERKNDPITIVTKEMIQERKRMNLYSKEYIFLWGYETIFNWLGIEYDYQHKEQFYETIQ
jgi:hypothetical protein